MTSFKMMVCIKVWINFFKILLFCIPMQLIHFDCVNGFLNSIKEIIWQTEAIYRCPLIVVFKVFLFIFFSSIFPFFVFLVSSSPTPAWGTDVRPVIKSFAGGCRTGLLKWRPVGQIRPADHTCLALCQLQYTQKYIAQWWSFGPQTSIFELASTLCGPQGKIIENPWCRISYIKMVLRT